MKGIHTKNPVSVCSATRWISLLFPVLLATGLEQCSSIHVSADYNKSGNYSHYKTYGFSPEISDFQTKPVSRDILIRAVEDQMNVRGYHYSQSSDVDLVVDFYMKNNLSMQSAATNDQVMGMRAYRYGGGSSNTTVDQHIRIKGVLYVDIREARNKSLIWQGQASTLIHPDATVDQKAKLVDKIIDKLFKKYPVAPAAAH